MSARSAHLKVFLGCAYWRARLKECTFTQKRQTKRQTNRQTDTQAKQTKRHRQIQRDKQIDRQTDRQTDMTDKHTGRKSEEEILIELFLISCWYTWDYSV